MSEPTITTDVLQQRLEDQLTAVTMNDIKAAMDSFYTALVVNPTQEVAQLPEEVFKAVFLPYFSGQLKSDDDHLTASWIGIARSPYSEVEILDAKRQVLFRVPALFDSTIVDPNNHRPGDSMADIYSQSVMRARNIPAAGQRYLFEALTEKNKAILQAPEHLTQNQQAWLKIFERYGLMPNTATSAEATDVSDDLDYD